MMRRAMSAFPYLKGLEVDHQFPARDAGLGAQLGDVAPRRRVIENKHSISYNRPMAPILLPLTYKIYQPHAQKIELRSDVPT